MRFPLVFLFAILPSLAWADDYAITLSAQDLSYIGQVLGKQPYNEVKGLLEKLQAQIDKVNAEKAKPAENPDVKK